MNSAAAAKCLVHYAAGAHSCSVGSVQQSWWPAGLCFWSTRRCSLETASTRCDELGTGPDIRLGKLVYVKAHAHHFNVYGQVWYCTVKGLQPWKQPDAKNTKTNDDGGHTIWYDEQMLLKVRAARHLLWKRSCHCIWAVNDAIGSCQELHDVCRLPHPSIEPRKPCPALCLHLRFHPFPIFSPLRRMQLQNHESPSRRRSRRGWGGRCIPWRRT